MSKTGKWTDSVSAGVVDQNSWHLTYLIAPRWAHQFHTQKPSCGLWLDPPAQGAPSQSLSIGLGKLTATKQATATADRDVGARGPAPSRAPPRGRLTFPQDSTQEPATQGLTQTLHRMPASNWGLLFSPLILCNFQEPPAYFLKHKNQNQNNYGVLKSTTIIYYNYFLMLFFPSLILPNSICFFVFNVLCYGFNLFVWIFSLLYFIGF